MGYIKRKFFELVVILISAAASGLLALYFWKFDGAFSNDQDDWGQFGDFMGGALNPILGFVTVIILTTTLRIQKKEIKDAKLFLKKNAKLMRRQTKIMRGQALENTFFRLLEDFNSDPLVIRCKQYDVMQGIYYATHQLSVRDDIESPKDLFESYTGGVALGSFRYVVMDRIIILVELAGKISYDSKLHFKLIQTAAGVGLLSAVIHHIKSLSSELFEELGNVDELLRGVNRQYVYDEEIAKVALSGSVKEEVFENFEGHLRRIDELARAYLHRLERSNSSTEDER